MRPAFILRSVVAGLAILLLWRSAAVGDDTSAAKALFRQLDASGDGVLTMDEATAGTRSFFQRLFKEAGKEPGDRVTFDEFQAANGRLRTKSSSGSTAAAPRGETPPDGIRFLDADGDGKISRSEWSKFTQSFSRLDSDKDNALSANELAATGGAAELLMKLADANGDGKVARVEWARLVQSFARLDANNDKSLVLEELEKVADAAAENAKGTASLAGDGKSPTLWRGSIEGRGDVELSINANRIEGRELGRGGRGLGAGTFTMTGDGKTGNLDAVYTEGDRAGQTCLGIYKLDGDTLTWCVNNRGGRPDSFSDRGRGNWLLTLNRVTTGSASSRSLGNR